MMRQESQERPIFTGMTTPGQTVIDRPATDNLSEFSMFPRQKIPRNRDPEDRIADIGPGPVNRSIIYGPPARFSLLSAVIYRSGLPPASSRL